MTSSDCLLAGLAAVVLAGAIGCGTDQARARMGEGKEPADAANLAAAAGEAKRFVKKVADAKRFSKTRDHYTVSVIHGQVSQNDNFIKSLLSGKAKLIISIESKGKFFDNEEFVATRVYDNADIKKQTDRPWGMTGALVPHLPGNVDLRVTTMLTINREDRLSQVFQALEANKDNIGDLYSAPFVGYSRLASDIIRRVFQTERPTRAFYWSGDILDTDVVDGDSIFPHRIILVSSRKDGDTELEQMDATKLSYDEAKRQLAYDGKALGRSYAVLEVKRVDPPDVLKLMFESRAPWAVLAVDAFLIIPVEQAADRPELARLSSTLAQQLKSELELLKSEHRFSGYDRAVALFTLANRGVVLLTERCKEVNVPNCPTRELEQVKSLARGAFKLTPESAKQAEEESSKLREAMQERFVAKLKTVS